MWWNLYPLVPVLQSMDVMLFTWMLFFLSKRELPRFPELSTGFFSILSEERKKVGLLLGKLWISVWFELILQQGEEPWEEGEGH